MRPDRKRAEALLKMALISHRRLSESDRRKYPTNTLLDYCTIIHMLLEALAYSEGARFKGKGTHSRLIDHVSMAHGLGESTRRMLQDLRMYRNRVNYEGFIVKAEYVERNIDRFEALIERLRIVLEK